MKKLIKYTFFTFCFLACVLFICFAYFYYSLNSKLSIKDSVFIDIPKSIPFEKVISQLNSKGLLKPNWLINNYTRFYYKFYDKKFYAGVYRFDPNMSNKDVIETIFSGQAKNMAKVTFPEGITLNEFAAICNEKLGVPKEDFIRAAHSDSLLRKFGIHAKSAEGYLMPQTYQFYKGENAAGIIKKLLEESKELWDKRFAEDAEKQGRSRHWIMTLASIIEAESPVKEERRTIASAFYNRLDRGMKLESDPTVQYGIGEKRKLTYKDLNSDSPYNTYKFTGIPPGPINSPSESSIEAALYPETTDYLFFVAVGDGSGRHNFAKSFNQHKKFVREYRKNTK